MAGTIAAGESAVDRTVAVEASSALRQALGDRLIAVVLFGSQARGEATEYSDWDLLVIAEDLPEKPLDRHLLLRRWLPAASGGRVSLQAKTPTEFEARVPSLYLDIALDGQVLYDPRGYATARLARLRRLMQRHGLYRERRPAGDLWRWRRPPPRPWRLTWESEDGARS